MNESTFTHPKDPPWSPTNFRERFVARRLRIAEAGRRQAEKIAAIQSEQVRAAQIEAIEQYLVKSPKIETPEPELAAPTLPPVSRPRDTWEGGVAKLVSLRLLVARYFNISVDDLVSARRTKNLTYPRHVGMYLGRKLTNCSFGAIAIRFGNRDHTVSVYALNKIGALCLTDWLVAYDVAHLEALFS